jgi:hypothetical protein
MHVCLGWLVHSADATTLLSLFLISRISMYTYIRHSSQPPRVAA